MAEGEASKGDVRGTGGATACAKRGQCRRGQHGAYSQKIGVLTVIWVRRTYFYNAWADHLGRLSRGLVRDKQLGCQTRQHYRILRHSFLSDVP